MGHGSSAGRAVQGHAVRPAFWSFYARMRFALAGILACYAGLFLFALEAVR